MTNIAQHAFNTQNKVTVLSDGSKLFSSDFDSKCKFDVHRFDQIKFLRKRIKLSFAQNFLKKIKLILFFLIVGNLWSHLTTIQMQKRFV